MNAEQMLLTLSQKYNGNWTRIFQAVQDKETFEETTTNIESNFITLLGEKYSNNVKNGYKPPFVLYYDGNIDLFTSKNTKLSFVGTKDITNETKIILKQVLSDENTKENDFVLVETLSSGTSETAIKLAIDNNIKVIAIAECGLNKLSEKQKALVNDIVNNNGLVMSEYPSNVDKSTENFAMRNRIVASLTDKVVVMPSRKHSGTEVLVSMALQNGKDILALPLPFTDSLNNDLVDSGATPFVKIEQLF